MIATPESYVAMTCGRCGYEADFLDFCHTPINGELPRGTHQCPACKRAWSMEKIEPDRRYASGLVIPGKRRAVEIPSIM